jgi:hypothetical protein
MSSGSGAAGSVISLPAPDQPNPMKPLVTLVTLSAAGLFFGGCASYVPPGDRADFSSFASSEINESFARKPTAAFPVGIAMVRVQEPGYQSYSTRHGGGVYGYGQYSVFTTREVESEADVERIAALSDVAGVSGLNRMLLPKELRSDEELRNAAARLKAEMLVLYTFDTAFFDKDLMIPATILTLGAAPTKRVKVHVTASALVMDTRTGFIYATFEASEQREFTGSMWKKPEHADAARLDAERAAFKRLVDEFEGNWPRLVERAKQGA